METVYSYHRIAQLGSASNDVSAKHVFVRQ